MRLFSMIFKILLIDFHKNRLLSLLLWCLKLVVTLRQDILVRGFGRLDAFHAVLKDYVVEILGLCGFGLLVYSGSVVAGLVSRLESRLGMAVCLF